MSAPDIDNLIRLLEERDADAVAPGDPTIWGAGRGTLTTDDVRAALLGTSKHEGLAS